MDERMKSRRVLELQLRNALAEGEFELNYQPIVNLRTNEISTCEALLRWRHPERGMLLPADFLPAAAELGVIVPIGEWVLRTACAVAAQWPDNVRVAVNLAPLQLTSPNLVPVVVNALAAAGLSTSRLEIEITEAVLWSDSAAILAKLHQLRELGVRLVMDDFGSCYASLSHLQSFPFDKIKIEQRLTRGLSEGKDPATIMRMVAALAGALCMISVAEGVETREQLEEVKRLGYTEMQGFLFSGAKNPEDMSQLFATQPGAKQGSTLQVPTRRIAMKRAPRPTPVRSRR
jgi:EAL domain-containing protein (putative c-di-GMP-specific phosphodiesterase class I)